MWSYFSKVTILGTQKKLPGTVIKTIIIAKVYLVLFFENIGKNNMFLKNQKILHEASDRYLYLSFYVQISVFNFLVADLQLNFNINIKILNKK